MAEKAELILEALPLRTRHVFGLSRGSEQIFENLAVRIRFGGLTGLGEIAPSAYYGERAPICREGAAIFWEAARERVPAILAAADPTDELLALQQVWNSVLRRNGAARAGLDMALWDLWGKAHGRSVSSLWSGGSLNCPGTSYTIAIGLPETLSARLDASRGFEFLKVKLGGPDDAATLREIRKLDRRPIRVDANCAWRGPEALERLRPLVEFGLELIEQPCPPRDLEGLDRVRREFGIPVFADESAETLEDVDAVANRVDGINVKLVKCGGPTAARQYIQRAKERGLQVMLGCMIESSVAIAAAAHLAPLAGRIDLDGSLLLDKDPFVGVEWLDGRPRLPQGPGLGVVARG